MWYLAVFLSALVVDLVPVVAPPAWLLMVFFMLRYHLDPWTVLGLGVVGSSLGRYLFSLYVPGILNGLIKQHKQDELQFMGRKLSRRIWQSWLFVFLYTLTPLSTSALFTAAALARVRALRTVPPFFFGKLASDALMIFTGRYALENLERSAFTTHGAVVLVLGVGIICAFLFVDWRLLLEKKQFRFNIHIWK